MDNLFSGRIITAGPLVEQWPDCCLRGNARSETWFMSVLFHHKPSLKIWEVCHGENDKGLRAKSHFLVEAVAFQAMEAIVHIGKRNLCT
ncbi:hypothetical protein V6N13_046675 [Hibiscus sabdariffa]|uniref:Uncharacterized protein n=2 Tax=Hibiscus sabdariffa TaxID=183260 RepID=A0ABR2NZL6_9ROSI